jgi:hypothetical protein
LKIRIYSLSKVLESILHMKKESIKVYMNNQS